MDRFEEMYSVLEKTVAVNRGVTRPFIERKTGLSVVQEGEDLGGIVTEADMKVSQYLLDGSGSIPGLRQEYPGSFSEEDDKQRAKRSTATTIYQVDPIDGTGDFAKTYESQNVIGPTTLVSRLERESPDKPFNVTAGLIFDVLHEVAMIADGTNLGVYRVTPSGDIKEVPHERVPFTPSLDDSMKLGRRVSYPQLTFDGPFMEYLQNDGLDVSTVEVGGAGTQGLQLARNYIEFQEDVPGLSDLPGVTALFTAQPDWKTWDTDPTRIIAQTLGIGEPTNIYGEPLTQNAASPELGEMHHTKGVVFSPSPELSKRLTELAQDFSDRNPDSPLTAKNYKYADAILALKK